MKHLTILATSLVASQLIAAAPEDTAPVAMTTTQQQALPLLKEFVAGIQKVEHEFGIKAVKASTLPICLTTSEAVDVRAQEHLVSLGTVVAKILEISTKRETTDYFKLVNNHLESVAKFVDERKAAEALAAEAERAKAAEELERLAAIADQKPAAASNGSEPLPTDDLATTEGKEPAATADQTPTDTTAEATLSAFEEAKAQGIEILKKQCGGLFNPKDGTGLSSWWYQTEYNTVRSPALVDLAAPLVSALENSALGEAEFTGDDAKKVINLITAFKAVFRDAKGVPFSGSQETKFITEKTTESITTYVLEVKANPGDAAAETITIKVDTTDAETPIISLEAKEAIHASVAMFR